MVNSNLPSRVGPKDKVVIIKHINSVATCYNLQPDWS